MRKCEKSKALQNLMEAIAWLIVAMFAPLIVYVFALFFAKVILPIISKFI